MKWLVYIFVIFISLGLIHRDRGKMTDYIAWLITSILILFGILWL